MSCNAGVNDPEAVERQNYETDEKQLAKFARLDSVWLDGLVCGARMMRCLLSFLCYHQIFGVYCDSSYIKRAL